MTLKGLVAAAMAAVMPASLATAQVCCEPGSPFVLGEAYPAELATCGTVGDWINRAPDYDGRISFAIRGELTLIEWDGSLAYLVMCSLPGIQVLCVTYSRDGLEIGDEVVFGGGYQRVGESQIMLDPCLVDPSP